MTTATLPPLTLGDIIKRLGKVTGSNGRYTACCPAHEDNRASLSVSQGAKGIVFHCHAGCTSEAVAAKLDCSLSQLFTEPQGARTNGRVVEAEYDYTDPDGKLLYQVVRYSPKDFRACQPDGKGGKIWNLQGVARVPYRLPELIEGIALGRTIYLTEGEKDADALCKRGFTATTNAGGADKWRSEYNQYFAGGAVVVLPDNDTPGKHHAESIKAALTGIAASVRVLELPNIPEKGDVSDWLVRGGTTAQLIALVETLSTPKQEDTSQSSQISDTDTDSGLARVPLLDLTALHGPIGEWVRTVAPETEASVAALLFSALVGVGVLIGRSPMVMLDGARHGVNLFLLLIGPTANGRKGTAVAHVRRMLREIDPDFATKNIAAGLTSGEGIIHVIRDPIPKEPGEKGGDPGVIDKRILVVEQEFGGVMKKMPREGNSLSSVIREAWDGYSLRTLTKGHPETATDPHVGIIGQITAEELRHRLEEAEMTNGFVNRFLLAHSERSQYLPFGGSRNSTEERDACERLRLAVGTARRITLVDSFTDSGRDWWIEHYPQLTTGKPGRVGAATQRGAAQVRRLALLFTVMDGLGCVDVPQLQAALAVWHYSEESAAYVFGSSDISNKARTLSEALLKAGRGGMDRTAMRKEVWGSNNVMAEEITAVIRELADVGSARQLPATSTTGRPREIWVHIQHFTAWEVGRYGRNGSYLGLNSHNTHNSHNSLVPNAGEAA